MADELAPMKRPKCCRKKGHKLDVAISKRETTQLCFRCGRGRRFANSGPIDPIPLDGRTADEIERIVYGGKA